ISAPQGRHVFCEPPSHTSWPPRDRRIQARPEPPGQAPAGTACRGCRPRRPRSSGLSPWRTSWRKSKPPKGWEQVLRRLDCQQLAFMASAEMDLIEDRAATSKMLMPVAEWITRAPVGLPAVLPAGSAQKAVNLDMCLFRKQIFPYFHGTPLKKID